MESLSDLLLKQVRAKLGTSYLTPATKSNAIQSRGVFNEAAEKYSKHFLLAESVLNHIRSQDEQQEIHPLYSHSLPLSTVSEIGFMDSELSPKPLDSSKKELLVKDVEANILELKRNVMQYSQRFDGWKTNMTQVATPPLELVNLLATYQKELYDGSEILKNWLKTTITKLDVVLRTINLFTLKGEALLLKIKVIQQKILMKTYTEESIQVLKEIEHEIQDRLERAKAMMTRTKFQLNSYQALGPEFDAIAEQHAILATDAKRLRDANSVLRKRAGLEDEAESE